MKMTGLLAKAFDAASHLPETDQDAIASIVFDEIASEAKWAELFAKSHDWLERNAEKALSEFRNGKTLPLDPDKL
jgi:hypothetical protein